MILAESFRLHVLSQFQIPAKNTYCCVTNLSLNCDKRAADPYQICPI